MSKPAPMLGVEASLHFRPTPGDELFSLTTPDLTCYNYLYGLPSGCPTLANHARSRATPRFRQKTISDGTKLPNGAIPNHHIWYESPSFIFAKVPFPVQERQRVTAPQSKVARPRSFAPHTGCRGHPCRPPRRRLPLARGSRVRDTFNNNRGICHGRKSNQSSSRRRDRVHRAQPSRKTQCD
jgi:hypothetical protein